jgi:putative pyruvate formate lyase activating enzyme
VDIYLPDFKYISPALAAAYSAAPDYAEHAAAALSEMVRQVGPVCFDGEGMLTRGVVVRHLVLPGARRDSMAVLDRIANTVRASDIRLSLMSQYTPDFAAADAPSPLHRRVTEFEYQSVLKHAVSLGFDGYFQHRSSANAAYTPDFEGGKP